LPNQRAGRNPAAQRVEEFRARAAWSRIRYFTPHQRLKAARETRALRSNKVVGVVLSEAFEITRNEPGLAGEWATFGIELVALLPTKELADQQRIARLGEAYTVLGNAFRVGNDYQDATAAIQTAYAHLENRWDAHLANLYSIHASLTDNMGDIEGAVSLIEKGIEIYTALRDRTGIARLKVQHANILREVHPAEARVIAADALLVLPHTEFRLAMLAHCIISQALAEAGDGDAALVQLEEARPLINQFREPWLDYRVQFLEALILEKVDHIADAERLYAEVARIFWHREMYRESFMVRLRLFEFTCGGSELRKLRKSAVRPWCIWAKSGPTPKWKRSGKDFSKPRKRRHSRSKCSRWSEIIWYATGQCQRSARPPLQHEERPGGALEKGGT
jgi:tetratricopeptide (TPR) repeat protein